MSLQPGMLHAWHIEEREYARQEQRRGRRHGYQTLDPRCTALLVIDMVPFFVDENPYCRGIVSNIATLTQALRDAGGTIAWVLPGAGQRPAAQVEFLGPQVAEVLRRSGGDGPLADRLWHEFEVHPGDVLVEKAAASAFFPGRCPLPAQLEARGITTVLITGTVTNVCCESSARDASTLGYRVIMVADANAARRDQDHNATLYTIYRTFGDVRPTDEVLELIRSGSAASTAMRARGSHGSDEDGRSAQLRHELVDTLVSTGRITSTRVEAAFRTVARHAFVPAGTPLEDVYHVDRPVITKRDERGASQSSVSATYIQARMIEQASLQPGMRVLEVGSGGYNAALLAEVVGAEGRVVSVDIDAEITDRAAALLDKTGYGSRVRVLCADAARGVAGEGVFDRIVVTVGAWDIPPALLGQLAADGVIVVPLRMNGVTRTIALRRDGDHLVSTSSEVAGFVPMQGDGAHAEQVLHLADRHGRHIRLRFDDDLPHDCAPLSGALTTDRTEQWSGITVERGVSFADLHLWFASFLPGFCLLTVDDDTDLANERGTWFPFGVVRGDSFAYLTVRPLADDAGVEFGARAYGPCGHEPAAGMVEQIQAWDRRARRGPAYTFAYWPSGTDMPDPPSNVAVLPKTHGLLTISWPGAS